MTDAGYGYFTFYNNQPQKSYVSLWVGNAGNSGDPVTLLAVHVDARDYIANNANPIKFHYGVYGPLTDAAGNNTVTVDFANLTIPEPSSASLMVVGLGMLFRWNRKRV
ncbi:MAG: PEP-CTERM sorting domain-containing protein [Verrucomicrobia bacterium]|nr:PEP-CTERM sorting domain-containing protein [Verrucomicrobiota bacterium]